MKQERLSWYPHAVTTPMFFHGVVSQLGEFVTHFTTRIGTAHHICDPDSQLVDPFNRIALFLEFERTAFEFFRKN